MSVISIGRVSPRVIAIIPARGGSKGVPGKNLRRVGGRSLVARAVDACLAARLVDAVYVSTDDADIAKSAEAAGAEVIMRPAELSGDTASSEAALLHALDQLIMVDDEPEVLVFVQCTSPFIASDDLDRGIELIIHNHADSVFSAVATYDFLWRASGGFGLVTGQNHDAAVRPRRQEREPDFRETGAFYVMSAPGFRAARHRFFGRTAVVQVPELTAVDIDHLHDLTLAGALAQVMEPPQQIDVDAVITDFDGVHTDDSATVAQDGRESVRVSRADGLGVERLRSIGIPLLIVSKEINPVVQARATKLGVEVMHSVEDKRAVVCEWLAKHGVGLDRAAYLGNDVNDLGPMGLVGWPVAVADAHPSVQQAARLVLSRSGGHGAVRELCDLVIEHRQRTVRATGVASGRQHYAAGEAEATATRESSGEGAYAFA
ncbi:MAG TPA: acylneuraminate cytidylyltransferase [Propionibacteriaceae bacterium]|nr:acylneuraminate cytidylyltransferase [Propionibacteriaceae bacterium]